MIQLWYQCLWRRWEQLPFLVFAMAMGTGPFSLSTTKRDSQPFHSHTVSDAGMRTVLQVCVLFLCFVELLVGCSAAVRFLSVIFCAVKCHPVAPVSPEQSSEHTMCIIAVSHSQTARLFDICSCHPDTDIK